jgi:hypothetical protein
MSPRNWRLVLLGAALLCLAAALGDTPAQEESIVPRWLSVAPGGRHFVDADGAPFFWLGDTAWTLFTSYTREEVIDYLEARRRAGFNVILIYACVWGAPGGRPNVYGEPPFLSNDPTRPNERFFQHVDFVVEAARQRGLIVGFLPFNGNTFVTFSNLFDEGRAREFGRYLGRRYSLHPNIVWVSGGDTAVFDKAGVYRAWIAGVRETDAQRKLVGYHPGTYFNDGMGGSTAFAAFNPYGANEAELDFHMAQSWAWYDQIPWLVGGMYYSEPVKPAVFAEGAYEGGVEYPNGVPDALSIRRQAWWAFLNGAAYTYGHNHIWRVEPDWRGILDSPGTQAMLAHRRILERREWWRYEPEHWMITSGKGAGYPVSAAARHPNGDRALVYLSVPGEFTLALNRLASPRLRAVWIDPATGVETPAGEFENSGEVAFQTPAGWVDALIALEPPPLPFAPEGVLWRGVNLAGPAVIVEGERWFGWQEALDNGLSATPLRASEGPPRTTLDPAPGCQGMSDVLRSQIWRGDASDGEGFTLRQILPAGYYHVYLWTIEDYTNYYRNMAVKVQGHPAGGGVGNLALNQWRRYGPFPAAAPDGVLEIEITRAGKGDPAAAGMAIYSVPPPE